MPDMTPERLSEIAAAYAGTNNESVRELIAAVRWQPIETAPKDTSQGGFLISHWTRRGDLAWINVCRNPQHSLGMATATHWAQLIPPDAASIAAQQEALDAQIADSLIWQEQSQCFSGYQTSYRLVDLFNPVTLALDASYRDGFQAGLAAKDSAALSKAIGEFRQPSDAFIEQLARLYSQEKGLNPDALHQHSEGQYPDDKHEGQWLNGNYRIVRSHFAWRKQEAAVCAILRALADHLTADPVREESLPTDLTAGDRT